MKTSLLALFLVSQSMASPDSLVCHSESGKSQLIRNDDGVAIAKYDSMELCEEARLHSSGGVVCVWFTPDMPVGPGGWNETGWRPMNIKTKMGLGRRPHLSKEDCLNATQAAGGGVVCTNTGVGAKAANIETNMWCGASSQLKYCLEATRHAKDLVVCSFPSDGTGAGNGWVRTRITSQCDYQSNQMSLQQCNQTIQ